MRETSPARTWLIGFVVFLVIVVLGELAALVLEYLNNFYLRQYVSDNFVTTIGASVVLVVIALGAGYVVSRRLGAKTAGPWVPTFAKIGSFVGRRHRLIVLFWILLLVGSFPLSTQLSHVVTSSTSGGQSSTSQSAQAQNIIAQEFPRPQSNTSAIILLQGNNVTDNTTRLFTLDLEKRLLAPGVLDSVENFTSIYSLARSFLTVHLLQSGDNYTTAVTMANETVWGQPLSNYSIVIPTTILADFI